MRHGRPVRTRADRDADAVRFVHTAREEVVRAMTAGEISARYGARPDAVRAALVRRFGASA